MTGEGLMAKQQTHVLAVVEFYLTGVETEEVAQEIIAKALFEGALHTSGEHQGVAWVAARIEFQPPESALWKDTDEGAE